MPVTSVNMVNETGSSLPNANEHEQPVSVANGVALIPANLQSKNNNGVQVNLLLAPITEDSNSAHSTLQAGTPATNALANAVVPQWRECKCYFAAGFAVSPCSFSLSRLSRFAPFGCSPAK